ncbi:hypothetical protein V6N12_024648 [Hibiscus sabdariffa]|uniref:Uncharacterized protein n=1 Tax=Hibiscus sabdariffa TaxID=183260 RepID=A0ABR2G1E2_9ROSI
MAEKVSGMDCYHTQPPLAVSVGFTCTIMLTVIDIMSSGPHGGYWSDMTREGSKNYSEGSSWIFYKPKAHTYCLQHLGVELLPLYYTIDWSWTRWINYPSDTSL